MASEAGHQAAVYHSAGDTYPYPTIEQSGAYVGCYVDDDGTLVVEVHPSPSDGPPAVAIRVDDAPVLEEPGLARGRHARRCVRAS